MSPTGNEGEQITLTEAAALTGKFRTAYPNDIKAHFIGKNTINDIMVQEGYMGIRVYHGLNANSTREIVIVGVDEDGNDMLDVIIDRSFPCPNMCSKSNDLNS